MYLIIRNICILFLYLDQIGVQRLLIPVRLIKFALKERNFYIICHSGN